LYVVVSERNDYVDLFKDNKTYANGTLRQMWLHKELQGIDNIKIITIDESNIPQFPDGWASWAELLKKAVPDFDIIFGGENEYTEGHKKYFPDK